jgi:hypothetical protein
VAKVTLDFSKKQLAQIDLLVLRFGMTRYAVLKQIFDCSLSESKFTPKYNMKILQVKRKNL